MATLIANIMYCFQVCNHFYSLSPSTASDCCRFLNILRLARECKTVITCRTWSINSVTNEQTNKHCSVHIKFSQPHNSSQWLHSISAVSTQQLCKNGVCTLLLEIDSPLNEINGQSRKAICTLPLMEKQRKHH